MLSFFKESRPTVEAPCSQPPAVAGATALSLRACVASSDFLCNTGASVIAYIIFRGYSEKGLGGSALTGNVSCSWGFDCRASSSAGSVTGRWVFTFWVLD